MRARTRPSRRVSRKSNHAEPPRSGLRRLSPRRICASSCRAISRSLRSVLEAPRDLRRHEDDGSAKPCSSMGRSISGLPNIADRKIIWCCGRRPRGPGSPGSRRSRPADPQPKGAAMTPASERTRTTVATRTGLQPLLARSRTATGTAEGAVDVARSVAWTCAGCAAVAAWAIASVKRRPPRTCSRNNRGSTNTAPHTISRTRGERVRRSARRPTTDPAAVSGQAASRTRAPWPRVSRQTITWPPCRRLRREALRVQPLPLR